MQPTFFKPKEITPSQSNNLKLPRDVWRYCLSFLNGLEVGIIQRVCKSIRSASEVDKETFFHLYQLLNKQIPFNPKSIKAMRKFLFNRKAVSRSGNIFFCYDRSTLGVLNTATGTLREHELPFYALEFSVIQISTDEKRLLIHIVNQWNEHSGYHLWDIECNTICPIRADYGLQMCQNGQTIVVNRGNEICIYDIVTSKERKTMALIVVGTIRLSPDKNENRVYCNFSISGNGEILALLLLGQNIEIWSREPNKKPENSPNVESKAELVSRFSLKTKLGENVYGNVSLNFTGSRMLHSKTKFTEDDEQTSAVQFRGAQQVCLLDVYDLTDGQYRKVRSFDHFEKVNDKPNKDVTDDFSSKAISMDGCYAAVISRRHFSEEKPKLDESQRRKLHANAYLNHYRLKLFDLQSGKKVLDETIDTLPYNSFVGDASDIITCPEFRYVLSFIQNKDQFLPYLIQFRPLSRKEAVVAKARPPSCVLM